MIRNQDDEWTLAWLSAVANGEASMSQRKLQRVEERPGGIEAVCKVARSLRVHLAVFTDDRGVELVAATRQPIRVLC